MDLISVTNMHFGNTHELDISYSTISGEKEDNDINLAITVILNKKPVLIGKVVTMLH